MTIIRILSIVIIVAMAFFETSLAQRLPMPSIERCGPGVNSGVKGGFRAKGGCGSNQDLQPGIKRPIGDYGNNQGNRQPDIKKPIENYENIYENRQPGIRRPIEDYGDNRGNRQPGVKRPIENYGNNPGFKAQQSGTRRPIGDYDATGRGCGVKGGCSAKGGYGSDRRTYRGPEDYGRRTQQDRGVYSNIQE